MAYLDLTQGKLFPTWTMSMPQTLVFRFGAETSGMISNMRSLVTDPATNGGLISYPYPARTKLSSRVTLLLE